MTGAELQNIQDMLATVPKSIADGGDDYQNRLLNFAYFMRDIGTPVLLAEVDRLRNGLSHACDLLDQYEAS